MFVRYFGHVDKPWEEVERRLLADPSTWMPALLEEAYEEGDRLRPQIGLGKNLGLSKEAVVSVGRPLHMNDRVVLPANVEAATLSGLFPKLTADLEIAALGPDRTKLILSGTYEPPLGLAGAVLDRVLLHHVAEAVVKNFVEGVVERLLQPVASQVAD